MKPGNKVKTGSKIPAWCFEKQAYLAAVLRGLFDTDGYICYSFKRIEIMFGRFAEKAKPLVNSISRALSQLQIKHNKIKRDGRRFIRFYNIPNVLKFFKLCGSSNYRNIVRFLLWRLQKREARIEKEGINELFKHLKNSEISIDSIQVPFLWNVKNKKFIEKIKEDELILQGAELRSSYNWSQLMREILEKASQQELSQALKINTRSIRRWREGQRLPSYEFVPVLLELAESNDIRLEELKKNGTGNNRAVS